MAYDQEGLIKLANEALTAAQLLAQESDIDSHNMSKTIERMRDIRANVTIPFSERNLRIVVKRAANLAIQGLAWEQQNGTYEHLYTFQDIKTLLARIRNHLEHGIPLDAE